MQPLPGLILKGRFGRILRKAWRDRYAGYPDWFAYAYALKSNPERLGSKKQVVSMSQYVETSDVDHKLLASYKQRGYVYQAPFGLFADHYQDHSVFTYNAVSYRRWRAGPIRYRAQLVFQVLTYRNGDIKFSYQLIRDAGRMDPSGRGLTVAGRVCGIVAVVIACIGAIVGLTIAAAVSSGSLH